MPILVSHRAGASWHQFSNAFTNADRLHIVFSQCNLHEQYIQLQRIA